MKKGMTRKDMEKRNIHIKVDYLLWVFEAEKGIKVKDIVFKRDKDDNPEVKIEFMD